MRSTRDCKWCRGTGRVALLTTEVACECMEQSPRARVVLSKNWSLKLPEGTNIGKVYRYYGVRGVNRISIRLHKGIAVLSVQTPEEVGGHQEALYAFACDWVASEEVQNWLDNAKWGL